MLGQDADIEYGILLAGRRVLLGTDGLKSLRYAQGVHVRSPLKEHMLHQVGNTRDLVPLVAATGPDPDAQRDARRLLEGLGEDPQAPRKVLLRDVGIAQQGF